MSLPSDYRNKLLAALQERGVEGKCGLCGHNDWAVIDQAVSVQITDLSGSFQIPPPQIPSAGLICNNCGNIRLFSLAVLRLLPTGSSEDGL